MPFAHRPGFNEFLAASLNEGHIGDGNLRMAFDRLDYENSGRVTLENLKAFTGATVNELALHEQITDDSLRDALLHGDSTGVNYETVRTQNGRLDRGTLLGAAHSFDVSSPDMFE